MVGEDQPGAGFSIGCGGQPDARPEARLRQRRIPDQRLALHDQQIGVPVTIEVDQTRIGVGEIGSGQRVEGPPGQPIAVASLDEARHRPGQRGHVELTVTDHMLRIEGERKEEEKVSEKGYLRHEVRYGSFSRMLPLPEGVTEADITANYKDGILEIRIPTPEVEPAKKIPVIKG